VEQLNKEKDDFKTKVAQANTELEKVKRAIGRLDKDIAQKEQDIKEEKEAQGLNSGTGSLIQEMETARRILQGSLVSLDAGTGSCTSPDACVKKLDEILTRVRAVIVWMKNLDTKMQKSLAKFREQAAETLAQVTGEKKKVKDEIEEVERYLTQAAAELSANAQRQKKLAHKVKRALNDLNSINLLTETEIEKMELFIRILETRRSSQEDALNTVNQNLKECMATNKNLESAVQAAKQQETDSRSKLDKLGETLKTKKTENDAALDDARVKLSQAQTLESQAQAARDEANSEQVDIKQQLEDAKTEKLQKTEKFDNKVKELRSLE